MSILYKTDVRFPDSILVRNFTGVVEVDDIIRSWEYLLGSDLLRENIIGVINDLSDCELRMNISAFQTLIAFLKENDRLKKIKLAVVSSNPKIVVFPALGEQKEHNLRIKPFTTIEAAEYWITDQE